MSEDTVDVEKELADVLAKVQPDLQDIIKRGFTNVAIQQSKNGETAQPEALGDISYFSKNTQVNLIRMELLKPPSFHVQSLSLDLKCMSLSLRCSLGEVNVRALYSSFNENLYNLIPVMSEGHVLVTVSNMCADVRVGLLLEDDVLAPVNPGIDFLHDEVSVKLSWPSPQRNGGYEFTTTEQLAKHIDDLPLTAALSGALSSALRRRLLQHLALVLRRAAGVSELLACNPALMLQYTTNVGLLAQNANKIIDVILINVRRTLLQSRREVLELPPLVATFTHKVGSVSYMGKFETDNGWIKNLATINRINDVSVRVEPHKTSFYITLKIKDLKIGYDEYRIKWAGACPTGRLQVTVNDNALHLALTVGVARGEPYAQLDDLRVCHMDGVEVHATGLGALSWAVSAVRAWAAGAAHAHAAPLLQQTLARDLHLAFAQLPLHDMLSQQYGHYNNLANNRNSINNHANGHHSSNMQANGKY